MSKPIEMFVRQVLSERERALKLRAAIAEAWTAAQARYPDQAWWRRKSTRAAVIWEHAVDNVIETLRADDEVRVVPHYDTVSFVIEDAVLLRIKKANIELQSSNYPTHQAALFHDHEVDLFGFPGLQRVEAAYVLNRFETAMDWIGIVARDDERQLWQFELEELRTPAAVLPLEVQPKGSASNVVRLKGREDRKSEDGLGEE